MNSQSVCLTVAFSLAAAAFVGCGAPAPASTALTAADVARPTGVDGAAGADGAEAPPGQLVCRTKSAADGTSELYVEWQGKSGKGLLRRVTPSGMLYVQRVEVERASGMIVADDTAETDLVTHAAVVREESGKPRMRLGDGARSWSTCE